MATIPSNYDPANVAKLTAALKANPSAAAKLKDAAWVAANPQAVANLKNYLITGTLPNQTTSTPTAQITSLPTTVTNKTPNPPTAAELASQSNNNSNLADYTKDAVAEEQQAWKERADANKVIVENAIKPLEDLYNQQSDDFKSKFAAQWATIAKQEAVGEQRLAELDSEIRASNKNNIDRLARREAGQTAVASSTLSAKGLSDQFVRNVASEVGDKFEDSRLKAQSEYINNLNTLAKSYQDLYQQLYENRAQLTRDEFEFAKVVATRVKDIGEKRETAEKEYLKMYDPLTKSLDTKRAGASEKETADYKRELDKKRWDEADESVKRQMLYDSFIKAGIQAGEVTPEEVTEALTKGNIDDALNWLASKRKILNPNTGERMGGGAAVNSPSNNSGASGTTTTRTTGATKNTNGVVNPLEDTYNAYIGAVKGTQFEQDYINAYKAKDAAGMQKAWQAANASKTNNSGTGAGPALDMKAVQGLLTKVKSLSPAAKKILTDGGFNNDLKIINDAAASNADKNAAFERVKRQYALMVKQSPETQELEKTEQLGKENARRSAYIVQNDFNASQQNALKKLNPSAYNSYIATKQQYLSGKIDDKTFKQWIMTVGTRQGLY